MTTPITRDSVNSSSAPMPAIANPNDADTPFTEADAEVLAKRGISVAFATRYGLRSVPPVELMEQLGLKKVPSSGGLAIPYPNVEPPYVRARMHDCSVRYLAPAGREVPVYVPNEDVARGAGRLVVVEAPLKALALVEAGIDAVGLGGVATMLKPGEAPTLNESWSSVVLRGREVVLLFDAGRATNPDVARGEARLAIALERAGARVNVAALPLCEGRDQGPDDFLVREGKAALEAVFAAAVPADPVERVKVLPAREAGKMALAELLDDITFQAAIVERGQAAYARVAHLPQVKGLKVALNKACESYRKALRARANRGLAEPSAETRVTKCIARDGAYYLVGRGSDEPSALTNFTARIVEDREEVDGLTADPQRTFLIEGTLSSGAVLPPISLGVRDLADSNWPLIHWGSAVRVAAEPRALQHVFVAISENSTPIRTRVVTHPGWLEDGGEHVYAHAHGLIGASRDTNLIVDFDERMSKYALPEVDSPDDVAAGAAAILNFVDLNRRRVGLLLLAAAFRAPLVAMLPVDGVLHLYGVTGSYKTMMALVAMSFFGAFEAPPASWGDTSAAIESLVHSAAHALVVIDDYAPKSSEDRDEQRRKLSQTVRAIGNGVGRQRMRADMTRQKSFHPRALVMSTGEDVSTEASISARMLNVEVRKGDVDLERLTGLQQNGPGLRAVMRRYIAWLAARYDVVELEARDICSELTTRLRNVPGHARTVPLAGNLLVGLEMFCRCAEDDALLRLDELDALRKRSFDVGAEVVADQAGLQQNIDPVRRFFEVLADLYQSGAVRLGRRDGSTEDGTGGAPLVGWRVGDRIWLIPQQAYAAVTESIRRSNQGFPLSFVALNQRLVQLELAHGEGAGHHTVYRTVAGARHRVLDVSLQRLQEFYEIEFTTAPSRQPAFPQQIALVDDDDQDEPLN